MLNKELPTHNFTTMNVNGFGQPVSELQTVVLRRNSLVGA